MKKLIIICCTVFIYLQTYAQQVKSKQAAYPDSANMAWVSGTHPDGRMTPTKLDTLIRFHQLNDSSFVYHNRIDLTVFEVVGSSPLNVLTGGTQILTIVGNELCLTNGGCADLSNIASADDQQITLLELIGNTLTLELEDGGSANVDLSTLDADDNQNFTNFSLTGSTLSITIERGNTINVDLSALVGSDGQTAGEVSVDNSVHTNNLAGAGNSVQDVFNFIDQGTFTGCLLYTSPSPRD